MGSMETQEYWHCVYCGKQVDHEGAACCGESDSELLPEDEDFEAWLAEIDKSNDLEARGDEPGMEIDT